MNPTKSLNIETITTEEQALNIITALAAKFQLILGRSIITKDDFASVLGDAETGELTDAQYQKCKEFFFDSDDEGDADEAAYALIKRRALMYRDEILA